MAFPVGCGSSGNGGGGGEGGIAGAGGTPAGYNKTWRGVASDEWFDPLNWEPEGVPVATDNVYISPDAIAQPNQTQNQGVIISERDGDASLTLAGYTLNTVDFICCNNGAVGLIMEDPADRLVVDGQSRFRLSTGSTLSAGEIEVRGDVQFCAGGLETPFRSTGTNIVVSGQNPQSFFGESGCSPGAVVLSQLELVAPADLTLNMPVQMSGDLLVPQGASIAYLNVPNIFSTIGGDIDPSGSMTVDFPSTAKLSAPGTLKLNATGVLDDAGDIINLSACDPKDGTIVNVDPCP